MVCSSLALYSGGSAFESWYEDQMMSRLLCKIAKGDSYLRNVLLSARTNSALTGRIFIKLSIWLCFENMSRKIQVLLKSDNKTGTLRKDQSTFLSYLAQLFLEWEMFRTNFVEKIKNDILSSISLFWKFWHLCSNVEKYRVIKRSLCTWWLQYKNTQKYFKQFQSLTMKT
jgi:hypothetical protein